MHDIEKIKKDAEEEINICEDIDILNNIRVKYLGKKGSITSILKTLNQLNNEKRKEVGLLVNKVKQELEEQIKIKNEKIKTILLNNKLKNEKIDVTISKYESIVGKIHPLNIVLDEIIDIFKNMGFSVANGPEVELSEYNFDFLNISKNHPSRQESDTFYIDESTILRTQTSPVQIRQMKNKKLPIKIISPGKVYRPDTQDATHSPIFHQIEGLYIDKNVTMAHLKGTLELFCKNLYGEDAQIRFRPHHFPFTEPSAEVDIMCFKCSGSGCNLCKNEGWIEILGCGMVNYNVLKNCGIDPDVYSGFAFGLGLERIVMRKYNIDNLRVFYDNDIRFLKQF